jgi:nitrite reductase/ring-hydroxylating ferredoxin subunit
MVDSHQVVLVTAVILKLFRTQGSRERRDQIRFRYLIERLGVAGVGDYLKQNLDFPLQPCDILPPPPTNHEDFLGWFKQKQDDLWAVGVCIPVGRLRWDQLEGMAAIALRWGDGTLRTTHDQSMIIPNIPTRFKKEVCADLASYGLSEEADSITRNVVACTGKQFCNLAVTETKGYALQLIERLRKKALVLHGIRIHMSGCINACGQHHTADIGLKGVRVRRLLGAKDGFDVFLGGAMNRQVQLALPYKMGVDVDQMPHLVEEVIREYYLHRTPGQTFSAYWRQRLDGATEAKALEEDYRPPTWVCEKCDHRHQGEDPPVFCPSCSALRRHFARLETEEGPNGSSKVQRSHSMPQYQQAKPAHQIQQSGTTPQAQKMEQTPSLPIQDQNGFCKVALVSSIPQGRGLCIQVNGKEIALFRVNGGIYAIDNLCPHEGGSLADGEIKGKIVTCPLHAWTFDACTGCGIEPGDAQVARYETRIEKEDVFIKMK